MKHDVNVDAFFALVRAGLWEQGVRVKPFEPMDFAALYELADDQSVVGLVAAGLEQVEDRKIVKPEALPFLKKVFSLEQRNQAMDAFIAELVAKMREAGIYTVLVKGQGIARCYARPQWRASGDVDLFLDAADFEKAKAFLLPLASSWEQEGAYAKHLGMTVDSWAVELHGTLRCGLSSRMDKVIDAVQDETFAGGKVRVWRCGGTDVFLPGVDSDILLIFTHFLKHFYKGGIGLRQICDWCRLLWTARSEVDAALLERRLRAMGLMSEWRAFAAYAVGYLGMPVDAMPLYSEARQWARKAEGIQRFILLSGNFGQRRDLSYYVKYPFLIRKTISLGQRLGDLVRHARVFPLDSLRFFPGILFHGLQAAARGE